MNRLDFFAGPARVVHWIVLAVAVACSPSLARAQAYTFTPLTGSPGGSGGADGPASRSQFATPWGVASDAAGNIYIADSPNRTVRRIPPGGVVSTLAGVAGLAEPHADGTGSAARFTHPVAVAVDGAGNLYVADRSRIRKVTGAGVVTTFPGNFEGSNDGTGTAARFRNPRGQSGGSGRNLKRHRQRPDNTVSSFALTLSGA
jgi:hypothetical protein